MNTIQTLTFSVAIFIFLAFIIVSVKEYPARLSELWAIAFYKQFFNVQQWSLSTGLCKDYRCLSDGALWQNVVHRKIPY